MNLPAKNNKLFAANKIGLMVILSALFLFSCKDANESLLVGEQPDILGATLIDTLTVDASTVLLNDSIITANLGTVTAGTYNDPVFGKVYAEGFIQFAPNDTFKLKSPNAIFDSLIVKLNYIYTYPDSNNQSFKIYPMTQELFEDDASKSTFKPEYDKTKLINSIKATPAGSKQIFKFSLNRLGQEIVDDFKQYGKLAPDDFVGKFNGFAMVPSSTSGTIFNFLMINSNNVSQGNINLYYHLPNDTTRYVFNNFNFRAHHSYINSNRTGTILASLGANLDILKSKQSNKQAFVQEGTGILSILKFPGIDSLKKKINGLNLVRAELIIEPQDTGIFKVPSALSLYHAVGNNNFKILPYNAISNDATNSTKFSYDKSKQRYTLPITRYIVKLLKGQMANNGIFVGSFYNFNGVNRLIMDNSATNTSRLRLKLYYVQ